MLPSATELKIASKCNFDLYTITNFSFMDLALHRGLRPSLKAVVKKNIGNQEEMT